MKKNILFAIALFYCAISFSQNFNYQAVVRDASNNPVTSQSMTVLVRIIAGGPSGSVLYNEVHTVTSNAQGVITFPVGGGTSGANFQAIDWSTQNHWIDIQVDLAGGSNYTQIGTSKLQFVPYAMYALNSGEAGNAGVFTVNGAVVSNGNGNNTTDDFVFGSSQLDNNGSFNAAFGNRMFYDKSKAAFRAGYTSGTQWDEANVGEYSVAFGEGGVASGRNSFSMGRNANATGNEAVAFGLNAGGFADYSRGFGLNARAFGINATAIGRQLNANSMAEIQLGQYSNFVSGSTDTWVPTDRLFVIGNGQEDINLALNSDALVMLKNGNTTLNGTLTIDGDNAGAGTSFTLPAQDGTSNQIMQTDGSGNVSWVTPAADAIPNGGTNGYVLSTDGSGVLSWVTNDDADNDPTNEIELPTQTGEADKFLTTDGTAVSWQNVPNELPTGGASGQVLSTDGSGVYSWADQTAIAGFATTGNLTSNSTGDTAMDDFVFGSTQIDNITTTMEDNNRIVFDKSKAAFRAGSAFNTPYFNEDQLGGGSVGFGVNNLATGVYSSTMGYFNNSSGYASFTAGNFNAASGVASSSLGSNNTSEGAYSFSTGLRTTSESLAQITLGTNNTAVSGDASTFVATDRLFVLGNGADTANKSDAVVVLKNGNTTINGTLTIDGDNQEMEPGYTFPAQDGTANQVMTTDGSGTVSWTDAATGSSGAFSTTSNLTSNASGDTTADDFLFGSTQLASVSGTDDDDRLFFDKSKGAFRAGRSTGTQWDDSNIGFQSAAFGSNNIASEQGTFATGESNSVSGFNASVFGSNNTVSGNVAGALGSRLTSESYAQFTIGQWNTAHPNSPDASGWINTDRLLVVGNGTNGSSKSDALVMLKNGNTTLNGQLTIDADNQGAGTGYTLPGQDGTANQVLTTDGSGNVAWAAVAAGAMLPSGGTDGQLLKTDGSGNYAWVTDAVDDADNDPTNEIELPTQTGQSGKILTTDGTATSWIDAPTELPAGGTNGQLLGVSGVGIQWLDSDEVILDNSPTNEIELPVGGANGQVLQTDGSGNYTWTDNTVAPGVYSAATLNTAAGWEYYNAAYGVTSFQDPRYRKVNNIVTLEGMCSKNSAVANADTIMTLPVGYRPTKIRIFTVQTENGAIRVDVNPNGTVLVATGFDVNQNWISLDGLTFSID